MSGSRLSIFGVPSLRYCLGCVARCFIATSYHTLSQLSTASRPHPILVYSRSIAVTPSPSRSGTDMSYSLIPSSSHGSSSAATVYRMVPHARLGIRSYVNKSVSHHRCGWSYAGVAVIRL